MQQEKEDYKIPYHYLNVQNILLSILKQLSLKFQTIMFTKRTEQIVFSIVSETQIISCGFKKIILPKSVNPYMEYEEIVLVLTLSGQQDCEEISQFSTKIDKVSILNLGICSKESKSRLKKIEFKEKNSIRGFKQQNLDFFCYLHNTYILSSRKQLKSKQKLNKKRKAMSIISEGTAVDRLCSFLFSYENFSEFEFYVPKVNQNLAKLIKQTMEQKLGVLDKYGYKGLTKNQGMSSVKTRVIVIERIEQLSPHVLSLYFGPLAEQLNIVNNCRFVSIHSTIYNQLYSLDLLKASQALVKVAEELSSSKDQKINSVNLNQTKKILEKAYNPNLSKEELQFHQTLLNEINKFMGKNCELLALQQSIANKITEEGQSMRGSKIVQQIYAWCEKNGQKYERYLGLIMEAFAVHSFWWYQKNQLMAGISDEQDKNAVEKYVKKCKQIYKINSLKQKPPKKDEDGSELREMCFRHDPPLLKQYLDIEQEIKEKKITSCEVIKINSAEVEKIGKKTRTIIYINSIIGYNQLAMLLNIKNPDVDIVCLDLVNTKEWVEHQLFSE